MRVRLFLVFLLAACAFAFQAFAVAPSSGSNASTEEPSGPRPRPPQPPNPSPTPDPDPDAPPDPAPSDRPSPPPVCDPVGCDDGSVYETAVDVRIPCPDIDLVFRRSYGSWSVRTGPLGYGWTHGYDWRLEEKKGGGVQVWSAGEDGATDAVHTFEATGPGASETSNADGYRLVRHADGRCSVTTPRALTYSFETNGMLSSISSWNGTTVALERDPASGRLVRAVHPNGKSLRFEYGAGGLLSRVATPDAGTFVELAYEHDGVFPLLSSVERHDGDVVSRCGYAYGAMRPGTRHRSGSVRVLPTAVVGGGGASPALRSASGTSDAQPSARPVLSKKTDPNGLSTRYACVRPSDGPYVRCVRSEMDGGLFAVDLGFGGRSTTLRRPMSGGTSVTRIGFDDYRREVERRTGAELRTRTYSDDGDIVRETRTNATSGAWTSTVRAFDARHRVVSSGTAYRSEPTDFTSLTWDDRRNIPRRIATPEGRVREWTEDGHDVTVCGAGTNDERMVTRILCTTNDRPYALVSPGDGRTDFSYDTDGYVSRIESEGLPSVSFTRDALGRVVSATLPGPNGDRATSFVRNWRGRPLHVAHPDGTAETFAYDGNGTKVVRHVDALGHEDLYRWVLGLPVHAARVVDGATNALFSVRHDEQLNVTAITDPLGRDAETYVLDVNERVVAVTNVEGQAMSRSYAVGDKVASETRFDGTQVAYGYDAAGNLSTVSYPGETLAFAYDRDGLLTSASNAVGVVSNAYDAATGWLTSSRGADGTEVTFAYSPGGDVTGVVSVAGTTAYALDKADRRIRIDSPAGTFGLGYCQWNGKVSAITNANGLVTKYAYDVMDRVTNIAWRTVDGVSLGGFAYSYDATGRIGERDISLGDPSQPSPMSQSSHKNYSYDDLDRLAMDGDVSYTYDAAGNRLAKIDPANATILYTLGLGDRLATYGRACSPSAPQPAEGTYTYDTVGNVMHIVRESGTTLDLTWNGQCQLVSVSTNGAFAESYAYDALGRRVSTTTLDGTIRHIYDDSWQCIADVDEQGNVVASYVWGEGIDNLLAVNIGYASYYPITDIQGTVWGYVDSANNVVAHFDYDAWGNILSAISTVPALARNRYRFQGREWSAATGLTNFRMRWYDAETGRWLSKDPIGLSGGLNLYVFCGNEPLLLIDAMGLAWSWGGFAEGFSRASQGVINAFTGGLLKPEDGLFYDWFNEQWEDSGEDTNECEPAFDGGMLGGRIAIGAFAAAGVFKAVGVNPWLGTGGLHPPHHGMGTHFEVILRLSGGHNLKMIIPGIKKLIHIGIH